MCIDYGLLYQTRGQSVNGEEKLGLLRTVWWLVTGGCDAPQREQGEISHVTSTWQTVWGGLMWERDLLEQGVFDRNRVVAKVMSATYILQLLHLCNA